MNRLIHIKSRTAPVFSAVMLVWFGLSPRAHATDVGGVLQNGNTADGSGVLINLSTGIDNSGFGFQALNHNTNASGNTASGYQALYNNSTGTTRNTATGVQALFTNTTGANNVATGWRALYSNTFGTQNTAAGFTALANNKAGNYNSAVGGLALKSNTFGTFNSALGQGALASNTLGNNNTACGAGALFTNFTGVNNTATGFQALNDNVGGFQNTANGFQALSNNVSGSQNTAIGSQALLHSTGSRNIAIGNEAGSFVQTADDVICIGRPGANVPRSCYIGHIFGEPVDTEFAAFVAVDSNGKLGTPASSRRFKRDVQPMENASEAILALKPVTFHYKSDTKNKPQFGLVAEDVAEVNPDLVVRDKTGEIYTVRYDAVNAMLLNEFLKEHRKVEEQRRYFESKLAQQQKQIEALTATVRKVAERVELGASAPQIAANED